MKKVCFVVIGAVVLLLAAFFASVPLVNNHTSASLAAELEEIPLPENTEYIQSASKAGKLVGNGNGMQYFGAILVKSELSAEALGEYYAGYNDEINVKSQESRNVDLIEHGSLDFDAQMSEEDSYYIVYLWGSGIKPFSELDIRGH